VIPLIPENITQLHKKVAFFTHILSYENGLKIIKKEHCLISNALSSIVNYVMKKAKEIK